MSRPLRIEFPGAWYHVMNRGAGRRAIFHTDEHRGLFLELLADVRARFGAEIHAYCLMDNHYHLLVHTPEGNLGRAMRHLNGVYTQRFNRSKKTDGPLFRGRYKAILIDADNYLLQLSRYIHRNPLEAKQVKRLLDYPWSSYPAYLGQVNPPPWLVRTIVLQAVEGSAARYQTFVETPIEEALQQFYGKARQSPVLGSDEFKRRVLGSGNDNVSAASTKEIVDTRLLFEPVAAEAIVRLVAAEFGTDSAAILRSRRGVRAESLPRAVAIYLCRTVGRLNLNETARVFELGSYSSVSSVLSRLRAELRTNADLQRRIERLRESLVSMAPV